MKNLFFLLSAATLFAGCAGNTSEKASTDSSDSTTLVAATADSASKKPSGPIADAATIIARKQVPVLCYHNIVDRKPKNLYEVTLQSFKSQMKALSDSGYKTITPDQYYNYLAYGAELPEKPVMITYDDTDEEQFSIAKMEMDKYGFKGVYFIMTITMGKPRYMNKDQVKQLADEGHIIGSHTWDHHRVDRLKDLNTIEYRGKKTEVNEWDFQLANTKKQLEELTGKPVEHFAYPFGIWSKEAIPKIEERGYKMAFQLSEKRDADKPLYTVRRIIVSPTASGEALLRTMKSSFK